MLERLIGNQAIAEKIAENINRLTNQNTSRSDSVVITDDPGPSDCPGTAPDTSSKAWNHNPDIAVESASISLPVELNHLGGLNIEGKRNEVGSPGRKSVIPNLDNGLVNEISRSGNNVTLATTVDTRSYEEGSAVPKECRSERVNLHQSGQLHEETVSDLSCTSLLSLSNLDQVSKCNCIVFQNL